MQFFPLRWILKAVAAVAAAAAAASWATSRRRRRPQTLHGRCSGCACGGSALFVFDPASSVSDQKPYCEKCWRAHLAAGSHGPSFEELRSQLLELEPGGCDVCGVSAGPFFAAPPGFSKDLQWRCRECCLAFQGEELFLPDSRLESPPPPVVQLSPAQFQRAASLCRSGFVVASDLVFVEEHTAVGRRSAERRTLLRGLGCEVVDGLDGNFADECWTTHFAERQTPGLVIWGAPHWHVSGGDVESPLLKLGLDNDTFNLHIFHQLRRQFPDAGIVVTVPSYYKQATSSEFCRELLLRGDVDYAPMASDPQWHWRLEGHGPLRCLSWPQQPSSQFDLVEEVGRQLSACGSVLFIGEYDFALSYGCMAALGSERLGKA